MPIMTDGAMMAPEQNIGDLATSWREQLGASASQDWADSATNQLLGIHEMAKVKGDINFADQPAPKFDPMGVPVPSQDEEARPKQPVDQIDILDANDRVKKAGLDKTLTLPNQPSIDAPQLSLMMTRAQQRREREVTMERGPDGIVPNALMFGTSFLVGAVDPLNIASAFIPVIGELRYAKLLAAAGEGMGARAAVRGGVGAAQGVVGAAVLEPIDWYSHQQDGRDFGMADVMHNLMMGGLLGGVLHSGGGAISDAWRARKGIPQYPFASGEPLSGVTGTHIPAGVLEGADAADHSLDAIERALGRTEVARLASDLPPEFAIVDDMPPRAKEDAHRAALASLLDGEPVRSAELLDAAAQTDPRIAESFEAFHGSPHEFDQFTMDRIGTGEGAQSFGHGLYFAENPKVARGYQRTTSDKAFIDKVSQLYDETFSPGEAGDAIKEGWKKFSPAEQRLMAALEKDDWLGFDYPHQAVSASLGPRATERWEMSPETVEAVRAIGNMYRVRITADPEHLLDWDKPLREQSEYIRTKLAGAGFSEDQTGKDIYQSLVKYRPGQGGTMSSAGMKLSDLDATPENASGRMRVTGIAGIKYLDQGSREKGEGTRNFVVFDDKHIEIVDRNGVPVKQADMSARMHSLSAEANQWPPLPEGARVTGNGNNGPVIAGMENRWTDAVQWLQQAQTGDAIGVLHHPEVPGRIDVIWGTKAYGLEHIVEKHPEVLGDLPQRMERMSVARRDNHRILLKSADGKEIALLRTDFENDPKTWLLTAYERDDGRGGGTPESPAGSGNAEAGPARSPVSPVGNIGQSAESVKRTPVRGTTDTQAWHDLSRAVPEYDAPDAIRASNEAAAAPEPPVSTAPRSQRVKAALDAEQQSIQLYDSKAAFLTPEERALVEDRLRMANVEETDIKDILARGAVCLAAASGAI